MNIRPWTKADLAVIAQMEKDCFSDAWTEDMLADCLRYPYYRTFLAEEGGRVCGYGVLIALFEDGEIANIAVSAPFRRKGVGRSLMLAMQDAAKSLGTTRSLLEVREGNERALALYEGLGYREYGRRANYYPDGETAILMELVF